MRAAFVGAFFVFFASSLRGDGRPCFTFTRSHEKCREEPLINPGIVACVSCCRYRASGFVLPLAMDVLTCWQQCERWGRVFGPGKDVTGSVVEDVLRATRRTAFGAVYHCVVLQGRVRMFSRM